MDILLYAPQDFSNFASIIRILDFFGFHRVYVIDLNSLVRPVDHYSRGRYKKLKKVSCGAIDYVQVQIVSKDFFSKWQGRVIFTAAETILQRNERLQSSKNSAQSSKWIDLYDFAFEKQDLLVFGSEGSGLPNSLLENSHLENLHFVLTLPTRGSVDSLNLAMSVAVFLSEAVRQGAADFSENPLFSSKKTMREQKSCKMPKEERQTQRGAPNKERQK